MVGVVGLTDPPGFQFAAVAGASALACLAIARVPAPWCLRGRRALLVRVRDVSLRPDISTSLRKGEPLAQDNGLPLIKTRDDSERSYSIALLALCAAVLFYGLGRLPFIGPDEPRYAEVAREMYTTGDWVTPRLDGIKWFEKPPLIYWLSSGGYALFGENEFAARFGVTVLATFGVLLLFSFGRRVHSARLGYLGASALATSGSWVALGRAATCDLPLTVAMEVALVSFFLWSEKEAQRGRNRFWYVFCAALGLATLAKGLVGVVLAIAISASYLVLMRTWRIVLNLRLLTLGAVILVGVSAVWYAPMTAMYGREFIDEFFIGHHFQRYLSNKYRHPQPLYFFGAVAFATSFPWSFCLVGSAWSSLRQWRQAPRDPLNLFLWLWVVVPIGFFSLSGSKLAGYILPIFPAVALIVGKELIRWWGDDTPLPRAQSVLTGVLIMAAGIGSVVALPRALGAELRHAWMLGAVAVLVAAVHLVLLLVRGGKVATLYLPFGFAVIVIAAAHLVFSGLGNRDSLKSLSRMAVEAARRTERAVFFVDHDDRIAFYGRGLPLRDDRSELVTVISVGEIERLVEASPSQSLLVISRHRWSVHVAEGKRLRVEKIGEQRFNARCSPGCDWVLLRAEAVR